jgi:hypothetical protein
MAIQWSDEQVGTGIKNYVDCSDGGAGPWLCGCLVSGVIEVQVNCTDFYRQPDVCLKYMDALRSSSPPTTNPSFALISRNGIVAFLRLEVAVIVRLSYQLLRRNESRCTNIMTSNDRLNIVGLRYACGRGAREDETRRGW